MWRGAEARFRVWHTKKNMYNLQPLERLATVTKEYGLIFNKKKTKLMIIDRANNNRPDIKQIASYEVVNHFVYLGSMITYEGGSDGDIVRRLQLGRLAMARLTQDLAGQKHNN